MADEAVLAALAPRCVGKGTILRTTCGLASVLVAVATLAGATSTDFELPIPAFGLSEPTDAPAEHMSMPVAHDRVPASDAPVVLSTEVVGQLTGAGSPNDTAARWNVHGTDLGHMFRHKGALYMMFGDTYGPEGGDWRSNALARIDDPDPENGLPFAAMIEGATGAAKELLPAARIPGHEWTVIPTNAISIGDRMVLHYMSVRLWGADDRWFVRRSGLAYSDDDGQSWTRSDRAIWPGGRGFEQVAYAERDGFVYVFGIPQGRYGPVRLARVAPDGILDPASYVYWNGSGWATGIARAAPVVPAPAGELSVAWSDTHRHWLMMYYDPARTEIVLRTAPDATGPWSAPQRVASAHDYPGLYAPYIVPTQDLGSALYFTMSRWKPLYNVFLMKTELGGGTGLVAANDVPVEAPSVEGD